MKLPFLEILHKKKSPAFFLALLLRDETATAVIFEELDGKAKVIGQAQEHFSAPIEVASIDQWLDVLDKAISKAESSLPSDIETHKTIFGVKETWIDDAKIKNEYKGKLKKVCETLELSPIGFLVIHEAITHLLQEEEGAPVSAILIEVGTKDTAISLLRAGKVMETKRTKIEDSLPKTTDRILHLFTSYEVLPSRIIIFNGKDEEDLTQQFIGHSWSKSLPFLHVPQIVMLPKGFDAKAVLFGAASQMGFAVEETARIKPASASLVTEKDTASYSKNQVIKQTSAEADETHFGFVQDEDVSPGLEQENFKEEKQTDEEPKESAFDNFKEVESGTLLEGEQIDTKTQESESKNQKTTQWQETIMQFAKKVLSRLTVGILFLFSFVKFLPIFAGKKTHGGSEQAFAKNKLIFLIPPAVLLVVLLGFLFYLFKEKTIVTVFVSPKVAEKTKTVTLSTSDSTNFDKSILAAQTVSDEQEATVSTSATGTKEVGEKAKGSVTIYNSDLNDAKNFSSGTTVSANNLTFTLDTAVSIASASGDASDIKANTAKVNVTAKDPGKESNLPSGTKFTVDNADTSSVIAKNDTAFSGGSKKQITVVSSKDQDTLAQSVIDKVTEDIKNDIQKKASAGHTPLSVFTKTLVGKKKFSKDVGDETSTVSLTATVTLETLAYSDIDLSEFAKQMVQSETKDMQIAPDGIRSTVTDPQVAKDGTLSATVHATADLFPTLDQKKLARRLSGKSFQEAKEILIHMPLVKDATFSLNPAIPFLPKALSKFSENIFFVITHD